MRLSEQLGPFHLGFDTQAAFSFYEEVRHRLPSATFPATSRQIEGLLEIADEFDAFVFDAFGVLNVGNTPIPGAVSTLAALRDMNKRVFVATNAASFSVQQSVKKFQKLGYDFSESEIVTSRMAAERAIDDHSVNLWGVIANDSFAKNDLGIPSLRLGNNQEEYDRVDGFLFLSTHQFDAQQALMLEQSLCQSKRPLVIANPDVIAPREDGFSTEPGYCGHRIADLIGTEVEFHGKPFASIFELVSERLEEQVLPERTCMIGDTLHTDVLGGAAQGWATILITDHGLFKGSDVEHYIRESGIRPTFIAPSI